MNILIFNSSIILFTIICLSGADVYEYTGMEN